MSKPRQVNRLFAWAAAVWLLQVLLTLVAVTDATPEPPPGLAFPVDTSEPLLGLVVLAAVQQLLFWGAFLLAGAALALLVMAWADQWRREASDSPDQGIDHYA